MRKKILMLVTAALVIALGLSAAACSKNPTPEVQPNGFIMLNNYTLGATGRDDYNGYVGVKITVSTDINVSMLGLLGKFVKTDRQLYLLDETKAVVANVQLTKSPDAYYNGIAYVTIAGGAALHTGYSYYIVAQEAPGDFWYGEGTSCSENAYFSIDGVVMSTDLYNFAFMQGTQDKVLGPVDIVFAAAN